MVRQGEKAANMWWIDKKENGIGGNGRSYPSDCGLRRDFYGWGIIHKKAIEQNIFPYLRPATAFPICF